MVESRWRWDAPGCAVALSLVLALASLACQKPSQPGASRADEAVTVPASAAPSPQAPVLARGGGDPEPAAATAAPVSNDDAQRASWDFDAPSRVVAIGDVHGDLSATRQALELAGAIDASGRWIGGDLTVVQTGDQLDRGDEERRILDLLQRLQKAARSGGGQLIVLNGNHEVMNVAGDFRYVTPGGFSEFHGVESGASTKLPPTLPSFARARAAALLPGGPYAKRLAARNVIAKVDDTLFAHGGVRETHVDYGIARLNRETALWMKGEGPAPAVLQSEQGPIWTRVYSEPQPSAEACQELARVLRRTDTQRLVVGHTVQRDGITAACDDRVWRIDVGLASHYGGETVQVLQLAPGPPRVLSRPRSEAQAAE